jgi:hypothetical protein
VSLESQNAVFDAYVAILHIEGTLTFDNQLAIFDAKTDVLSSIEIFVLDSQNTVFDAHIEVLDANIDTFDVHGIAMFEVQYVSRRRLEPNTIASNAV